AVLRRGHAAAGHAQDCAGYRLHLAGAVGLPRPRHRGRQRDRRAGEGVDRRQLHHQGRLRHRGRALRPERYSCHHLRPRQYRPGPQAERVGDAGATGVVRDLHAPPDGSRLHKGRLMPNTVVFDLGNVLVRWNPRLLYEQLIADADELEQFFETVITHDWIREQDAGRPFEDGIALLATQFPHYHSEIRAFWERWEEMVPGAIEGTVAILSELRERETPLYALTNWSHETF